MASNVENDPAATSDADPGAGPEVDEPVPDVDPHPDFPDDFDDDVAGRESEEALPEQGRSDR